MCEISKSDGTSIPSHICLVYGNMRRLRVRAGVSGRDGVSELAHFLVKDEADKAVQGEDTSSASC